MGLDIPKPPEMAAFPKSPEAGPPPAGGGGDDDERVRSLSLRLGLTGLLDASNSNSSTGVRRRKPEEESKAETENDDSVHSSTSLTLSAGSSPASPLRGGLGEVLDGSLYGLRHLASLEESGQNRSDQKSPLSLPRHAIGLGDTLDADDALRSDRGTRSLPNLSLPFVDHLQGRTSRDSSAHSSRGLDGSRHSYRGDLEDSIRWQFRRLGRGARDDNGPKTAGA